MVGMAVLRRTGRTLETVVPRDPFTPADDVPLPLIYYRHRYDMLLRTGVSTSIEQELNGLPSPLICGPDFRQRWASSQTYPLTSSAVVLLWLSAEARRQGLAVQRKAHGISPIAMSLESALRRSPGSIPALA